MCKCMHAANVALIRLPATVTVIRQAAIAIAGSADAEEEHVCEACSAAMAGQPGPI